MLFFLSFIPEYWYELVSVLICPIICNKELQDIYGQHFYRVFEYNIFFKFINKNICPSLEMFIYLSFFNFYILRVGGSEILYNSNKFALN